MAFSSSIRSLTHDLLTKTSNNSIIRSQHLDANQLQKLSLTLGRPSLYPNHPITNKPTITGTPIPPGHHLIYFTPSSLPESLGVDGTDTTFSPDPPFTRRMWAGGALTWSPDNPLRVGDLATETTRILSAEPKRTKAGEEMIVVGVEKRLENARGLALMDQRNWLFRAEFSSSPSSTTTTTTPSSEGVVGQPLVRIDGGDDAVPYDLPTASGPSEKSRDFFETPVDLFRFSALTFNAHRIHYDRAWCREVEGHREVVVHGPLNLIHMLDFWRDSKTEGGGYAVPKSIKYRATAPFYGGERYRGLLKEQGQGMSKVRLWGNDGKGNVRVGMMGDIEDF